MKKVFDNLIKIHLAFWAALFPISVIARITFKSQGFEPLEYALDRGMYNVFILISLAGVLTSALLFLSVRHLNNPLHKTNKVLNLLLKATATMECVMFYASCFLMFAINKDSVIIAPILWIMCIVLCSAVLIVSKISAVKRDS